jgi:hypothetical protein
MLLHQHTFNDSSWAKETFQLSCYLSHVFKIFINIHSHSNISYHQLFHLINSNALSNILFISCHHLLYSHNSSFRVIYNTQAYKQILPRAVLNKNSSPSRQNRSHTLLATSSGNDLLYNVNILKSRNIYLLESIDGRSSGNTQTCSSVLWEYRASKKYIPISKI